ncbi:hypothetical protein D3C72_2481720 [compost metagenome]
MAGCYGCTGGVLFEIFIHGNTVAQHNVIQIDGVGRAVIQKADMPDWVAVGSLRQG